MSSSVDAELVQQRFRVVRIEADAGGDLLARRPRSLAEEVAQALSCLGPAPPVLPRVADQELAQLCRADPGTEIVRRVETRVHVREVVLARVTDPGRIGQALGVAGRGTTVVREATPELQLELELGGVAAEQERLEEDRRLSVLDRFLVREVEVLRVPGRLSRDCLDDVRVDLGERVIARELAKRVRQGGIAACVVEGVTGL